MNKGDKVRMKNGGPIYVSADGMITMEAEVLDPMPGSGVVKLTGLPPDRVAVEGELEVVND